MGTDVELWSGKDRRFSQWDTQHWWGKRETERWGVEREWEYCVCLNRLLVGFFVCVIVWPKFRLFFSPSTSQYTNWKSKSRSVHRLEWKSNFPCATGMLWTNISLVTLHKIPPALDILSAVSCDFHLAGFPGKKHPELWLTAGAVASGSWQCAITV